MDFDPSQFLTMAMSEEPNSTYTAPDLTEPSQELLTVEGGLQIEQNIHIPVPVFGNLQLDSYEMEKTVDDGLLESPNEMEDMERPVGNGLLEPWVETGVGGHIEPGSSNMLPVDKTDSSHTTGKKFIQCSFGERQFRRNFYHNSMFVRVKLFRLHCTICDTHLGCAPWFTERQMRTHKLLSVSVCRKCFDYYGDINFPIEDGSEIYCCWCGEGGEVFCCAKCTKTVCKKCISRNFGKYKVKEISENDNWICFICDPTDIYPHRAMLWGLQRYNKEMRKTVVLLSKEEKQEQLSKDSSHCCLKGNVEFIAVSLPYKAVLSKVPLCLIALPYRTAVMNQPDRPQQNYYYVQNNSINPRPNQTLFNTHNPTQLQNCQPTQAQPTQQVVYRNAINRPITSPVSRQVNPPLQTPQRAKNVEVPQNIQQTQVKSQSVIERNKRLPDTRSSVPQANCSEVNIDWLEKGINDVTHTVVVIQKMLDQFNVSKNDLKQDIRRATSFSEQFSHNIKIAICSLAKANQTMIDARTIAFDDHVNSIVNNIKASVESVSVIQRPPTPQPPPPVQLPETEEDTNELPRLNAALLCETVLEVEGNKENENGNKHQNSPMKNRHSKLNSLQRGRPLLINKRKKIMQKQLLKKPIQVINLVDDDDDDDDTFDASHYCKKYKITPCKVTLTRCD